MGISEGYSDHGLPFGTCHNYSHISQLTIVVPRHVFEMVECFNHVLIIKARNLDGSICAALM